MNNLATSPNAAWFAIDNQVQGGVHGEWPGLMPDELASGRYLRFTTDYRDVMGDILLNHFGHTQPELSTLLPNHTYSSVGIVQCCDDRINFVLFLHNNLAPSATEYSCPAITQFPSICLGTFVEINCPLLYYSRA